jgi:predicted DNA-binding protein
MDAIRYSASVVVRLGHSAQQQIRKLAEDLSMPQAHVVGELIKMGLTSQEDIVESVSAAARISAHGA